MLRQRLSEFSNGNFRKSVEKDSGSNEEFKISEWKVGFYALCLSLAIIIAKLISWNKLALWNTLWENKLVFFESVTPDGRLMGQYTEAIVLRTNGLVFPLLCGFGISLFTWLVIYLDSCVPGVNPPTPFSPKKYKIASGHSFHLGYVMAIVNGLLVFVILLINGLL